MKHRLFKLALFFLLGSIVNVAVAWGCAAWVKIGWEFLGPAIIFSPNPSEDWAWDTKIREKFGAIRVDSSRISSGVFAYFRNELGADVGRKELELKIEKNSIPACTAEKLKVRLPGWSRVNHQPQSGNNPDYNIEDARGWPFLTLRCSIDDSTIRLRMGDPNHIALLDPSRTAEDYEVKDDRIVIRTKSGKLLGEIMLAEGDAVQNGILLPVNVKYSTYDIRALPLRPIWPSFAINTIFYAALLWLLTLGPFTARRMIRRKQGRCIKCGYDLRGMDHNKCPECGWQKLQPHI